MTTGAKRATACAQRGNPGKTAEALTIRRRNAAPIRGRFALRHGWDIRAADT
jgi:hypothetical protein